MSLIFTQITMNLQQFGAEKVEEVEVTASLLDQSLSDLLTHLHVLGGEDLEMMLQLVLERQ